MIKLLAIFIGAGLIWMNNGFVLPLHGIQEDAETKIVRIMPFINGLTTNDSQNLTGVTAINITTPSYEKTTHTLSLFPPVRLVPYNFDYYPWALLPWLLFPP